MTDLFFLVQVKGIAAQSGFDVALRNTRESVVQEIGAHPAAIVFDLNCSALDPVGLIGFLKGNPETAATLAVGLVSHVNVELKRRAEERGCDVVVARSAFAQKLPEILRSLARA